MGEEIAERRGGKEKGSEEGDDRRSFKLRQRERGGGAIGGGMEISFYITSSFLPFGCNGPPPSPFPAAESRPWFSR